MRLNSIKPAVGATKNRKRVGRGIGSGSGKPVGVGIRAKSLGQGDSIRLASKEVRCPCTEGFLREVLSR